MNPQSDVERIRQAVNKSVGILAKWAAAEYSEPIRNYEAFLQDAGNRISAAHSTELEEHITAGMTAEEAAERVQDDTQSDFDRIIERLNSQHPKAVTTADPEAAKTQQAQRFRAEENDRWRLEHDQSETDEDDAARGRVRTLIAATRDRLKHRANAPAVEMVAPPKCPTCPVCKQRTAERSPKPVEGFEWWCWTCNTMFGGSESEFERNEKRREAYESNQVMYAKRAAELAAAKTKPTLDPKAKPA